MDHQEAIETLQDIHDVAEIRIKNGDTRGVVYIPPDKLDGLITAISAMQELQEYHKTGMTPAEVIRMQHGYAVKMTDLEDYQRIGTLVEVREVVEKQKWIPCSERLPEESGKYEVTASDAGRLISTQVKWQPKLKSWNLTGQMAYWKIIAWKPLPEPYHPDKCHG